ncbi:MAG: DUF4838 domain-containing protein [Candidatus Hydrogenedentales bacterium]|jgi:hypothetical protein
MRLPSGTTLLSATFVFLPCFSSALAQVSLVRDGEPCAAIVIADSATETTRYAASELVWHVEKATGATLPVVPESQASETPHTRVYLGDTETGRRFGIDTERLPREAFVMRAIGNDLFIAGHEGEGDPLSEQNPHVGTLFGVYELVERALGARWLWPGELGTYVPRTDTVELWAANETTAPALTFRALYLSHIGGIIHGGTVSEEDARLGFSPEVARDYGRALQTLLRRHRMGGLDAKPPSGHLFYGWWERYGKEHPEWFALREDGTRGHPDPAYANTPMCESNEELQDFVIQQWDGESTILLGPVDRPGRCTCANCRAWDGPQPASPPWFAAYHYGADPRSEGLFGGATSDRMARFWKVIQEKAAKRNPNATVSVSFIYENEFPAPLTDVKLGKNFYGEFVQWQDPHLRYFPMPEEARAWIREQWLGWRATGIRMAYRPNYLHDGYLMPHFETVQSGEFFKFAVEHGMEGAHFDSLTGQWASQGLRLYMHLRLMAKPDLALDAIRQEYLEAFGPAADAMDRYFAYWEEYATENTQAFIDCYLDVGRRYASYLLKAHEVFPPEVFVPAEALLEEALNATRDLPDTQFVGRVRFVALGLQHARLAVRLAAAYDGEKVLPEDRLEEGKAALEALVAFRKANERTFFSDLLHATAYWERPTVNVDELAQLLATK